MVAAAGAKTETAPRPQWMKDFPAMHPMTEGPSFPREGAFAFLSQSFSEVQRNAEQDILTIKTRAKVIKKLATRKLNDLENISLPAGPDGKKVSAGTFLRKLQENATALSSPRTLDEWMAWNNRNQRRGMRRVEEKWKEHRSSKTESSLRDVNWVNGAFLWPSSQVQPFSGTALVRLDNWEAASSNVKKWQLNAGKKMEESLKELETAANKTPSNFLQRVRENLGLNGLQARETSGTKDGAVAPLTLAETLESIVRESKPLLHQLGVSEETSLKVCALIRGVSSHRAGSALPLPAATISGLTPPVQASLDSAAAAEAGAGARADGGAVSGEIGPGVWQVVAGDPHVPVLGEEDQLEQRIARVKQSTGYRYRGGLFGEEKQVRRAEKGRERNIAIFTTACLPWMTGTAVNPLLRAAYLAESGNQNVTLLVPWLSQKDQERLYPSQITFDSPAEQEQYVRDWLQTRVGFSAKFRISFYPSMLCLEKGSILPVGDISACVPDSEADVAVLEEPEHLTWYYHGRRWTEKFKDVVGIVHTNYLEYVRREKHGNLKAFIVEHGNNWMVRAYCHKVIRLSGATQSLPRSVICNIHGVGIKFLDIGKNMAEAQQKTGQSPFSKGAYFLGKMVWGKGYRELLDLLAEHKDALGTGFKMDVYGSGEDSGSVQAEAEKKGLRLKFHRGRDHAGMPLQQYKVFINPSLSDVVCTTTAEALAMGKIVVCADHESNDFFRSFPNCYTYRSSEEFLQRVRQALAADPVPLSEEQRQMLSWEAATDRFLNCAGIQPPSPSPVKATSPSSRALSPSSSPPSSPPAKLRKTGKGVSSLQMPPMPSLKLGEVVDSGLFMLHHVLGGLEMTRRSAGAMPNSLQPSPQVCREMGLTEQEPERQLMYGM
eukprot:TRINITY_DN21040_c0_g1_i1.p1 TRINITY_DN21040_c0_g1~~TRINITY_DN21040_c0_g1_i1.p1  ORF type:complete len:887 (-),score=159.46 TRINITY_DN21040_c0_g1_i1:1090-3750(-)